MHFLIFSFLARPANICCQVLGKVTVRALTVFFAEGEEHADAAHASTQYKIACRLLLSMLNPVSLVYFCGNLVTLVVA